jgi:hypothetical protein
MPLKRKFLAVLMLLALFALQGHELFCDHHDAHEDCPLCDVMALPALGPVLAPALPLPAAQFVPAPALAPVLYGLFIPCEASTRGPPSFV